MYRSNDYLSRKARLLWCWCVYVCRTVCGYVFVYLCVRIPISQYNFVKCVTIFTKLYIEITGYICWIPGEAFWKYTGGGLYWHIKGGGGVLTTGPTRNRGVINWSCEKRGSQEQLLHTSADISRFPCWWYLIVMLVSIRWRLPSMPGIIWKQNLLLIFQYQKATLEKE